MVQFDDARSEGIVRAAEKALQRLKQENHRVPVMDELRAATAIAKRDGTSEQAERVRAILVSAPYLRAILEETFPDALQPKPFRGRIGLC